MSGIELLMTEHKYVSRMLVVMRNACLNFMDNKKMVEYLGETGKNVITHGMLVEHDLGRNYMRNLEEALNKYKNGDNEAGLDIIANAISYATLLENHIHKEDNVIFNFANRSLKEDVLQVIDKECFEYEEKNSSIREENIGILNFLEEKYI